MCAAADPAVLMRPRRVGVVRALLPLLVVAVLALAVGWPATTRARPDALALVYLDAERPGVSEVWLSAPDGTNRRMVASFGQGARVLDLRGSTLALAVDPEVVVLDLGNGQATRTAAGTRLASAYVADQQTVFFATRVGCGPAETKTLLGRVDAATGARTDLAEIEAPGAEILWHDPATDQILLTPRGCDPSIWALRTHDGKTGAATASLEVQGCGWVAASPNGAQALVSFASCTGGDFPELNVYSLPDGAKREVRFAKDAPSEHPFVYAPDGSRAAFGMALARGNPGGRAQSGGIWLLDASSLAQTLLWQDAGSESWAIDWSSDGSLLAVASVVAQGRCGYSVVAVATGEATPVEGIDGCGVNGTLVGFATLP